MAGKKPQKLCIRCHSRPAEVPDRNRPGRMTKAVCRECHARLLAGDFLTSVANAKGGAA